MRLTWLDLNSSHSHSSLSLPSLHAAASVDDANSHIRWQVVRGIIGDDIQVLTEKVYASQPDIIAASAWLFTIERLTQVIARIKALLPQCIFILGGPEWKGNNKDFLSRNRYINCVLRGEGELAFAQWLPISQHPDKWKEITGLCYIDDKDNYIDNGLATISNPATLPAAQKSCFFDFEKPFIQIESNRGCFNSCTFCLSGDMSEIRSYPINNLRSQLDNAVAHGIREIRVLDRTFNYHLRHTLAMLDLMETYSGKLTFHIELHPGLLNNELRQRLQSLPHGLLHAEAGIQSLHQHVLNAVQRKGGVVKSLEGIAFLASLDNLETHTDLIAGLPEYTLTALITDICELARLNVSEIQLELLKVLPGTAMRSGAASTGIIYSPMPPYEVLSTPDISPEQLIIAKQLSRVIDLYYNRKAWQEVFRTLITEAKDALLHFTRYLAEKNCLHQPLSQESRGNLLHDYCIKYAPHLSTGVAIAWVRAGLSLKRPAAAAFTALFQLPINGLTHIKGTPQTSFRYYQLMDKQQTYIIGYDINKHMTAPQYEGVLTTHQ